MTARSLAAIVFTDIVGYSAIVHRDEALGRRLLDRQRVVVRRLAPLHGGREVETAGDSFLLEFASAVSAVSAVVAIQKALAADAAQPAVVLRASVHLGDVEHRGREVYGDGVNIAARLLPLSPEGGMSLSAAVLGLVRQCMNLPVRSIGTPVLKNISTPVEVFVVEAHQLRDVEMPAPEGSGMPEPRRISWRVAAVAVATILFGAAVLQWQPWKKAAGASAEKSIAVLPLANTSGDPANEYFSDGLSEQLINTLGRVRDLKVIGRTSSFQFKNKTGDSRAIGEALGVAYLLEGSVRKVADQVRIAVKLVNAGDGAGIWSESYDREVKDVFAVQSEIASRVAEQLQLALVSRTAAGAPSAAVAPAALEEYLRGRVLWAQRTGPAVRQALAHFENAVRIAPQFALGHAGVADAHIILAVHGHVSPLDAMPLARAAAERAIQLDPGAGEPHASLGDILFHYDWDYAGSEREHRKAIQLSPGFATAHHWIAEPQIVTGHADEALERLERARALDPLAMAMRVTQATALVALGRRPQAVAEMRGAISLDPAFQQTRWRLVRDLVALGKAEEALSEARQAAQLAPDSVAITAALGLALARSGRGDEARVLLKRLDDEAARRFVAATERARIAAGLRDRELTLAYLKTAVAAREGFLPFLATDHEFSFLHDDPGFVEVERTLGILRR